MRTLAAATIAAAALATGAAAVAQAVSAGVAEPAGGAAPAASPKPTAQAAPASSPEPVPQTAPAASPQPVARVIPEKDSESAQLMDVTPARKPAASAAAAGAEGGVTPPPKPSDPLPVAGAASAPVRDGFSDADPQALLSVARSLGEARLLADEYGDPLIEARAGGRPYDITFYDCTANRDCQSFMLRAGFAARGQTEAEMAGWNRSQRFGKAYLDEAGNPVVELDVNMAGGVTRANIEDTFDRWQLTLNKFAGHVGY